MILALNIITHLFIIVGILAMVGYIAQMIAMAEGILERLIRVPSIIAGFLIYFMTRAIGWSFPNLIIQSFVDKGAVSFGLIGIVLPAVFGALLAWASLDALKHKEQLLAGRVVILVVTFMLTLFIDVYVAVFSFSTKVALDVNLLPNLSFLIGICLFLIFSKSRDTTKEVETGSA
jgi:hypothetical protein